LASQERIKYLEQMEIKAEKNFLDHLAKMEMNKNKKIEERKKKIEEVNIKYLILFIILIYIFRNK
jgi:hypothetical protein